MEIKVIYEDEDVLAINKPVGLLVHEDKMSEGETVVDWFLARVPSALGVGEPALSLKGEPLERSGVVHRLDQETSGIMVLAKNQSAFEHLKKQFHDRLVTKKYRAFVYGLMPDKWGTINRPIGRSASDFRKRSAERGAKGALREATTQWERLVGGQYQGEPFSYLKLEPKSGRTHQLRVHLKAIDRPIVGDQLYAGKRYEQSNNLGLNRLALHAHILALTLPNGTLKQFTAPVPEVLGKAAAKLQSQIDDLG